MSKRRILVVDDDLINRQILKKMLNDEYEVTDASSGETAIGLLEAEPEKYSVILLDIIMPGMDGYAVLERIRGDKVLSRIPVIITTSNTESGAEVRALSLGANDYIAKPYNPEIIRRRIRNTIKLMETSALINASKIDELTGLYNRKTFFEKAKEMISAQKPGYYIMACFDIDGFKVVNDQYGTEKGDEVLKLIADVFKKNFEPAGGICCRIMADNFAILYPKSFMSSPKLNEILHKLSVLDGSILPITFSIGRYIVDDLSLSASAMYDRATLAEATIKRRYDVHAAVYNESMREQLIKEQKIVTIMNKALNDKCFEIWFQPQYNHSTGALIGAEALVRWRDSESGRLVPPDEFIPVFERNGFIYELDKFVWEQTCVYLHGWLEEGRLPLPVSVNISRYDIFCDDFYDAITGIVKKYNIPVELLRLEITKSAFTKSTEQIVAIVKRLIDFGFTVEIDDFGSGYSSLNTLKDVPATILKLDMKFLEESGDTSRGGNILESIVRMAKWLGMSVIAEGVETLAQANYLESIGCIYVQGYLYAKPMPVGEYDALARNTLKEEKMLALETVETLDNNAFWDPKSMDTLIFNSYVGGACIFEYYKGKIEMLRANGKYAKTICEAGNLTINEALGISFEEHLNKTDLESFREALKKAIETREEITHEMILRDIPGCPELTYIRATLLVIAAAREQYLFYCTNENITAQREAEKKDRESAFQLREIMDNINGGVTVTVINDEYPVFIFANNKYYEQLGYTKAQFDNEVKSAFALVHPNDRIRVIKETRNASKKHIPFTITYRAIRRDGGTIWLQSNISIMNYPGIKDAVQLAVANDITDQKNAEQKVRATTERLQAIMDNVNSGIMAAVVSDDESIEFLFANDRYYELFGYTKKQFETELKSPVEPIYGDDYGIVMEKVHSVNGTGRMAEIEFRIIKRDKSIAWLKCVIKRMSFADVETPVQLSVLTDITAEKAAADELKETDDQLRFLNSTAHDLLAQNNIEKSVETVLEKLLKYFGGDRAYIFEFDYKTKTTSNTYEVCGAGITHEKNYLQEIPFDVLSFWLHAFDNRRYINIEDVDKLDDDRSEEKIILQNQGIKSLIAVPLLRDGKRIGFIGIDGPCRQQSHVDRLDAIGDYIAIMLTRRDLNARIDKDRKSMTALMNDTPGGFVRMRIYPDKRTVMIYANDGFCELAGMSHREVMETYGSDVYAGVHPDDIDYVRAEIAKMWDTGKLSVKHRLRRGDGGYIDVMVFGRLVRETPNDTYVNIYYADISEQVSIEDRRKELIENLPCGAAIYEISDTGIKALYVNSRYLMLVGHNAENLKGTTVIDLVHPDDRKILIKKLMSAIKEKREGTCDIRILCGDGEYRLFKATGNIEQNSDGKTMAYTTYTPISKEAVSYREMLPVALNAMMKASSDIAFVKDRNMKYVCCSSAFSRMVGYEDEKGVVGKTDYDMIDKDEADKYAEMDRQIVESGKPILNFIERIPSYDGVTRYATISKYLLYDSFGDVIGICGIGHDITNERTAYERLKLMTDSVFSGLATYEYCDSGIKIKYFNDNFCKILGYERNEYEQISSGNVRSTLYEEDWLIIHEQLKALIRDNSRIDCTCRIHRKDGSSGWLNIYGAISERREDALVINIIIYDVTESREKEERLRINDEEIRLAMSKIGKMIIIFDIPTRTLTMPRSYAEKHGLPEMITNVPESISAKGIIDSENETGYTDFYLNILNGEKQCTSESHIICPDGTWVWEHAESVTIFDSTGKPVKAIISVEDTTEQHNRSEEINTEMIAEAKRAHEYESLFFDAAAGRFAGIIKVNLTTGEAYRIDFENKTPHFKRVISKWDKLYKTFTDAIHPDDRNAVINKTLNGNIKDLPSGENVNFTYRSVILSEGYRWYTTTIRLSSEINSDNGETQHAATIFMVDVNDEIIERSKLKDLSEHDGLTDLFNRMKYDTMLETDYRDLKSCGVLFFDVNYLKVTNDTKGHDFGDGLLTLVADSIRSITNRRVHGYRYGGDEFIVVACNIEEREIDKLINMWHIRFDTLTCDRGIKGSVAVGKAWSAAPLSVANLVSDADKDMYHNKKIMKNKKRCGK